MPSRGITEFYTIKLRYPITEDFSVTMQIDPIAVQEFLPSPTGSVLSGGPESATSSPVRRTEEPLSSL